MDLTVVAYVIYLLVSIALTVWVARTLSQQRADLPRRRAAREREARRRRQPPAGGRLLPRQPRLRRALSAAATRPSTTPARSSRPCRPSSASCCWCSASCTWATCTCSTRSGGGVSWSGSRCRRSRRRTGPPPRPGRDDRWPAHRPPGTGTPRASRSSGSPSSTTPTARCAPSCATGSPGSRSWCRCGSCRPGRRRPGGAFPALDHRATLRRDHRRRRRRPGLPGRRRLDRHPVGAARVPAARPPARAPRPGPGSPGARCSPPRSGAGAQRQAPAVGRPARTAAADGWATTRGYGLDVYAAHPAATAATCATG